MQARTIGVWVAVAMLVSVAAQPGAGAAGSARLRQVRKQFGPPVMWVPKPDRPPVIDGQLDDAAWAKATPVTLRYLMALWEKPTQKTEARVLADDKAVYFAVKCAENQPERMIAADDARDGGLWSGDTVEFFLDPGHKQTRHQYVHVIVNPKGLIYDSKNKDTSWNADLSVKAGRFKGGWTVELAIPMKDIGVAGAIPKVWGLNINRQRPELGEVAPVRGIRSHYEKLKEPGKYREGEDTAWSPTYCRSSHIPMRFGHAVLEAGTVDVKPPARLLEVIYRNDFDDGKIGPFSNAVIADENFRGRGKCIARGGGQGAMHLGLALKNLDDVTLIMATRLPQNGRLYYYGRAPDREQCEADRHEVFMTKGEAAKRKFPAMDDYDTHGSMMAWKSHGRRRTYPGPWAMMTGHFSEPSIGSVMSPGTDWVILRTRVGQFRRQRGQDMVPLSQNYPGGLTFHAGRFVIDDFIIFRGMDVEPPETVTGVKAERKANALTLSWNKAKDNTITSYYRVYAKEKVIAETHRLSAAIDPAKAPARTVRVTAVDLYDNESKPSAAVTLP